MVTSVASPNKCDCCMVYRFISIYALVTRRLHPNCSDNYGNRWLHHVWFMIMNCFASFSVSHASCDYCHLCNSENGLVSGGDWRWVQTKSKWWIECELDRNSSMLFLVIGWGDFRVLTSINFIFCSFGEVF